jgi:phage shock protein A
MAIMLAKTYAALKAAGAPEGDAVAAAEELADYENRLTSIDSRLALIEGRLAAVEARFTNLENGLIQFRADVNSRFTMLTGALGINAAATIAILGVLLRGHGPLP